MANLHIICGNCGQSLTEEGMATWSYEPADIYEGAEMSPADVYIHCNNCAIVHSLNDYMKEETE